MKMVFSLIMALFIILCCQNALAFKPSEWVICSNSTKIVPASQRKITDCGAYGTLSNWQCSDHKGFARGNSCYCKLAHKRVRGAHKPVPYVSLNCISIDHYDRNVRNNATNPTSVQNNKAKKLSYAYKHRQQTVS